MHTQEPPGCSSISEESQGRHQRSIRVDRIKRNIALKGQLTVEQRSRLLKIANKCPMYRTPRSEFLIENTTSE